MRLAVRRIGDARRIAEFVVGFSEREFAAIGSEVDQADMSSIDRRERRRFPDRHGASGTLVIIEFADHAPCGVVAVAFLDSAESYSFDHGDDRILTKPGPLHATGDGTAGLGAEFIGDFGE